MSLEDFYEYTNSIIFEEEEVESDKYVTNKRKHETLDTRISSASFYKNSSSLQTEKTAIRCNTPQSERKTTPMKIEQLDQNRII